MSCEYECYCDDCHRVVIWDGADHDGNSCPECGKEWVRPLPKPEKWLVQFFEERARADQQAVYKINIAFGLLYFMVLVVIIAGWLGGYWL